MDATSRCDFDGSRLGSVATDASVLPISSTETDADELPIALTTGVGTDMHASTQALEDD